jgi:hypothetical protein
MVRVRELLGPWERTSKLKLISSKKGLCRLFRKSATRRRFKPEIKRRNRLWGTMVSQTNLHEMNSLTTALRASQIASATSQARVELRTIIGGITTGLNQLYHSMRTLTMPKVRNQVGQGRLVPGLKSQPRLILRTLILKGQETETLFNLRVRLWKRRLLALRRGEKDSLSSTRNTGANQNKAESSTTVLVVTNTIMITRFSTLTRLRIASLTWLRDRKFTIQVEMKWTNHSESNPWVVWESPRSKNMLSHKRTQTIVGIELGKIEAGHQGQIWENKIISPQNARIVQFINTQIVSLTSVVAAMILKTIVVSPSIAR